MMVSVKKISNNNIMDFFILLFAELLVYFGIWKIIDDVVKKYNIDNGRMGMVMVSIGMVILFFKNKL
tara:strand:+ start:2938 stop:3138 length:201 start_codon:yes stop_codon:yes gene_type:complete